MIKIDSGNLKVADKVLAIVKKLARMFGEYVVAPAPTTFSNLGIGQYLPK